MSTLGLHVYVGWPPVSRLASSGDQHQAGCINYSRLTERSSTLGCHFYYYYCHHFGRTLQLGSSLHLAPKEHLKELSDLAGSLVKLQWRQPIGRYDHDKEASGAKEMNEKRLHRMASDQVRWRADSDERERERESQVDSAQVCFPPFYCDCQSDAEMSPLDVGRPADRPASKLSSAEEATSLPVAKQRDLGARAFCAERRDKSWPESSETLAGDRFASG